MIEYYWRPGCPFCNRLDRNLAPFDLPLERHNIWEDADDAARVRAVANGNETVPTVIIGDTAMVNPTADEVLTVLREMRPELVPDDWEPKGPGPVGRAIGRLFREG